MRALGASLAELDVVETVDRFGSFVVDADERLDPILEQDLVSMLRMAREDHPGQQLEVVVIARQSLEKGDA